MRFPAEWEPQSAILIAWPHAGTDWAERLAQVERTYIALVAAITRFEPVVICVADAALEAHVRACLSAPQVAMSHVRFVTVAYDDTWLRDTGPVTLISASRTDAPAALQLLDFRFTGWGGKFEGSQDDQLVRRLADSGIFRNVSLQSIDLALEGGALETDGAGTLLTTWQCLHQRHPRLTREVLSVQLRQWLQQQRVLWLEHGALVGDDTDAHIDTLARFAGTDLGGSDAIVYQACDDPADTHYQDLQAMAAELAALRTHTGEPYRLFPLPWPRPIFDGGRRLAASYANFLIINGAVLMPAYEDAADDAAQAVLAQAFPGREIVPIPCRSLIWQNGSLHCITMQLPQGLVA